ncbi:hypothetical protein [Gardnerella sp. DNF00571G]|uniref:hypothetical protein n=1 Tax=Gardnerella sp. DNF00571G TaxID=2749052 RepID=UPI003BAE6272
MHFDSLSLLKVESTVCFQRKRRRERAVTRELFAKFGTKIWYKVGKPPALQTSHRRDKCNEFGE